MVDQINVACITVFKSENQSPVAGYGHSKEPFKVAPE
jgi:hypothetical protein